MHKHDLIIVGGSAAATAAGIYAARRNLDFKIITKDFGGEVLTSGEVCNWPGLPKIDGFTLVQNFRDHLDSYGVNIEEGIEVAKISKEEDGTFCVNAHRDGVGKAGDKLETISEGAPKCDYAAKTIIVATGVHPKQLGVPGEKEYRGKGVTYCTVCDGPLFAGKTVATIGGGNSALESALMLSEIATKVYTIGIMPEYTGDPILIDKLRAKKNVEAIFNATTTGIFGNKFVAGLKYKNKEGQEKELSAEGVFVHIGMNPNSSMVSPEVKKDQFGQIVVNLGCETNVPGLFAAGDVTNVPFKQIVIAAGQGCTAVLSAVSYLNKTK